MDFISLTEPGVGPVLIRHSEIVLIEPTAYCYSRIQLSTGTILIVEESHICVINKIKLELELEAALAVQEARVADQNQSRVQTP